MRLSIAEMSSSGPGIMLSRSVSRSLWKLVMLLFTEVIPASFARRFSAARPVGFGEDIPAVPSGAVSLEARVAAGWADFCGRDSEVSQDSLRSLGLLGSLLLLRRVATWLCFWTGFFASTSDKLSIDWSKERSKERRRLAANLRSSLSLGPSAPPPLVLFPRTRNSDRFSASATSFSWLLLLERKWATVLIYYASHFFANTRTKR